MFLVALLRELLNIAGREGFPDVELKSHGLVKVKTEEKGGLVFITQKEPLSSGALDQLPDLISPDQKFSTIQPSLTLPTGKFF